MDWDQQATAVCLLFKNCCHISSVHVLSFIDVKPILKYVKDGVLYLLYVSVLNNIKFKSTSCKNFNVVSKDEQTWMSEWDKKRLHENSIRT